MLTKLESLFYGADVVSACEHKLDQTVVDVGTLVFRLELDSCRELCKYLDLVVVDGEEVCCVESVEGAGVDGAEEVVLLHGV